MKTRYDKLIVVRAAASRMATAAFADAGADLGGQEALAQRLMGAAAALSPETGAATGAGLASQLELAGRMHAAHRTTRARVDDARTHHDEAALGRRAARQALDATVDIRRSHQKAAITRADAKAVPVKPRQVGR